MAASNNIEFEAAKFLQKLIQESKDEPAKLAAKLYVILQHMKSSGKEHSMPYQVISRAMETVISQHNLDIEALKSSRLPLGGSHAGESATSANAGPSQLDGDAANTKSVITEGKSSMGDPFDPSRQPIGPGSGHNFYQASMGQRASFPHEPESPSAADPRSPGLQNQERRDQSQLVRTTNRKLEKRKRGESSLGMETAEKVDSVSSSIQPRIAKVNKIQQPGSSCGAFGSKQEDQTQTGVYLLENQSVATNVHHERNIENFPSSSSFQLDHNVNNVPSLFKPSGGRPNIPEAMKNNIQDAGQILLEANKARDSSLGENGKSIVASGKLFNEQQLKQLRAQCLVFLAFRNGVPPKPLHIEIALGISHPKEVPAGRLSNVSGSFVCSPSIGQSTTQLMTKEASLPSSMENVSYRPAELPLQQESRPLSSTKFLEVDTLNQMRDVSSNVKPPASSVAMGQIDNIEKRAFDHELHPPIFTEDGPSMPVNTSPEDEDGRTTSLLPQPKHTMLEKWIAQVQKKKLQDEQSWLKKHKKAELRISSSFERLKENVSSSEDLAAKTKSVIELKKLQLLALQQRLRGDFLSEFFKPVVAEMDHLKSYKKHRHGRRIKQIERYEQKMKEERQKKIRERQREFFGDIEIHKERLDDVFKIKRERLKGFNKFVKEFHKRKERIHREKIDRIQREKITLLKINDVEGYLRMVQDAKSDRVKQLLKETEKYLQKLGSKLREAKAANFEHDGDDMRSSTLIEKNDAAIENEDECDQAKHYKESNEKYYMMAHSIKEEIAEQPATLQGGKLREYQMNGLRWLVSLYNNHLNGILADEMGLGKTVQVISLICYLMEAKNDRGPFLVVVPSSVLPGWDSEISFWAPAVHKIVYAGPPEERRRLFKERIVHRKFNVLLTTYEYLMNKHDRPKLSKVHWRYIIIDEGHRIKNASCKLNADLKHYQSSHRLLLTGTPLQNSLEELWALLNFLLPNIFNSSEDFSQWFNKPFQGNGDNSTDEALLSEEENLLIINRLHQVLRPFVLRRLKHKVENELPEKIERLIRCEASAYQKLLVKRVEENLGSLGNLKARSVQNSVMELRNICNHPYLSQLHAEEVDNLIPQHYLPPIVRLCGKLEMLDRLLPKLKATNHRVLFFSTMTRLLDVMEEYLSSKQFRYLRLDGHTSGGDRGALIDLFNQPNSPFFIFLLSIRAGGVGVNLQAADTVIIFDTDWNPQVDLQAQARAHRIGQKKDVLVLRFETVRTVEEQVRAAAEHKLGVANQSITAGFFDNDTSAEDRREYLESLLRESKKEEATPVLDDDALNDILARSESEIDIFESVDKQRREEELTRWAQLVTRSGKDDSKSLLPLPSRLVTDDDLKSFYEAMKIHDEQKTVETPIAGLKRKSRNTGSLNTEQYGRGKRAREVRSYEEQMTEEEFEKMCQVESPRSPVFNDGTGIVPNLGIEAKGAEDVAEPSAMILPESSSSDLHLSPTRKDVTPPSRRGRGRPKRAIASISSRVIGSQVQSGVSADSPGGDPPSNQSSSGQEYSQNSAMEDPSVARLTSPTSQSISTVSPQVNVGSRFAPQRRGKRQAALIGGVPRQLLGESGNSSNSAEPFSGGQMAASTGRGRGRGRKSQTNAQAASGRGRRSSHIPAIADVPVGQDDSPNSTADKSGSVPVNVAGKQDDITVDPTQSKPMLTSGETLGDAAGVADVVPSNVAASASSSVECSDKSSSREQARASGEGGRIVHPEDDTGPPGFVSVLPCPSPSAPVTRQSRRSQSRVETPQRRGRKSALSATPIPDVSLGGPAHGQNKNVDVRLVASMMKNMLSDSRLLKSKGTENSQEDQASAMSHSSLDNVGDGKNDQALFSKLSPGGSAQSAIALGLDNQASSHQSEILNAREMEGRRVLIPATKAVVLGLEGKCASGSLGIVARQYETGNLGDMPAFPPGFEKFEPSAAEAIEGGVGSIDAPIEPPLTTETADLVTEDQNPLTKEDQLPSSGAEPIEISQEFKKNTEVSEGDHDLSNEPSSVENKPVSGVTSGAPVRGSALEVDCAERLSKHRTLGSSQFVTDDIKKSNVDNSTESTSDVEEARNLDEDQKRAPSNVGLDSKDLDVQGEVWILSTGVCSSDVSASEESLDKAKEPSEPANDIVDEKISIACSKLESVPNVSELWEKEPEAKSKAPLLVSNVSATSMNVSHGEDKRTAVIDCLVGNSIQLEGDGKARPGHTHPELLAFPDESSNMAADEEILPTTSVEAFPSEMLFKSCRVSQESGDTLVESLRSESLSFERKPGLDDALGSTETLADVAEKDDQILLKDNSMVISETVSVDAEKGVKKLHPTEPTHVECVEDAVMMNEDIPRVSCTNVREVDHMCISDGDKVIPEGAADIFEASAVIGETQKALERPFAMSLMVDNDASSLAKPEVSDSETGDGGGYGQINEKEIKSDSPSESDCPASPPMRNREISVVREQSGVHPTAEVEDSGDREKNCHADELNPERSYESKEPLSDLLSDGHAVQMIDGQGLCQVDEVVSEESYRRNELSSPPEGDLSSIIKQDVQAEEMKVYSNLPQSSEVVSGSTSAGNQLASSISMIGESSETKANVDMEFDNVKETSRDSEVIPDNLLQESFDLASYASCEKQVVESHEEDRVTIGLIEEKAEAHEAGIEVEDHALAEETSNFRTADSHDTVVDNQGDASLADPVVPEAAIESLNLSLVPDKLSSKVLERDVPSSVLLTPKEKQVDSDEKVQMMQALGEGRDALEFYTPLSSPMIVDEPKISEEEVEINESTGDVKDSPKDCNTTLHDDKKQDPSEVIGFMPEVQLKGDRMSTETVNELACVSMTRGEGSETETCQDHHSLQCVETVVENIVDADSHVVKPEATECILYLPSEVLKELQRNDDAVNERGEIFETLQGMERTSDADGVDDVVVNSPLAGNEYSELLSSALISEDQIENNNVKGQTGADEAVTCDGREPETTCRDDVVVMDGASAGNEETRLSVLMKDSQSANSSGNKQAERNETVMLEEREAEAIRANDIVNACDENVSSELLPSEVVNAGQSEDDIVNEQTGDETVALEEQETEDTSNDVVMDDASTENEPSEMLPAEVIKEDPSEDNTVKEQIGEGETVMGEEEELLVGHIDDEVMKCSSPGNEPSEGIKESQNNADVVNELAKEYGTITTGGSQSDSNFVPDDAPTNELAGDKTFERTEVLAEVPEIVMSKGPESVAIRIDDAAVNTASATNESLQTLPCHEAKDGEGECHPVIDQSEGPEPVMNDGLECDTPHIDHVELDNASAENEVPEVLPSYIPEEVMREGHFEDEPMNEQTGPEPKMSAVREHDASRTDDAAIVSASVENETSEVLPSDMNMTNAGKSADHSMNQETGGLESLVSKGYESDDTGDDDMPIDSAATGNECSEITAIVLEDVAGKEKPSSSNDFRATGSESFEIPTLVPVEDMTGEEKQPSPGNNSQAAGASESPDVPGKDMAIQEDDGPSSTKGAADKDESLPANDPEDDLANGK